jgi:hypothetical protein
VPALIEQGVVQPGEAMNPKRESHRVSNHPSRGGLGEDLHWKGITIAQMERLQDSGRRLPERLQDNKPGMQRRHGGLKQQPEMSTAPARLHDTRQSSRGERHAQPDEPGECIGDVAVQRNPLAPAAHIRRREGDRLSTHQMGREYLQIARIVAIVVGTIMVLDGIGLGAIEEGPAQPVEERQREHPRRSLLRRYRVWVAHRVAANRSSSSGLL